MVRVDEETGLGVALATDCNGRFAQLDPYAGAQLALAEAYRNVATSGARPLAVTDCLNFGSPEDPARDVAVRRGDPAGWPTAAASSACRSPAATSASTTRPATTAILPTPVVGVLGVIDDVTRRARWASARAGSGVYLLGDDPRGVRRLGVGARRARTSRRTAAAGRPGRRAPAGGGAGRDRRRGPGAGAHDLSDGGLAQALVECSLRPGSVRG